MQLVGADADIGAQTVAIAVGEPGARVVEDARRVDLRQKSFGGGRIGGDDRLRVLRSVGRDVRHRRVDAGDLLDSDDVGAELVAKVGIRRRFRPRQAPARRLVAAQLDARRLERLGAGVQRGAGVCIPEQGLRGVARGGVGGLAVDRQPRRHRRIGAFVNVKVADTGGVAHHGDVALGHDVANELRRAARDDHLDQPVQAQHGRDVFAAFEQHGGAGVDPRRLEHAVDHRGQRPVRPQRLPSALEQDGVAALPRQADDLRAHPLQHQAVIQLAPERRAPDQIRHRGELIEPVADAVELARVEAQALDQRGGDVFSLGAFQILRVGGERLGAHAWFAQRRRQRAQQLRSPIGPNARELATRELGGLGGRPHLGLEFRFAGGPFVGAHQTAPITRLSRVIKAS